MLENNFLDLVQKKFEENDWRVTLGVREVCETLLQTKKLLSVQDLSKKIEKNSVSIYRILYKLESVGLVHQFDSGWQCCSDPSNQVDQHHFLLCDVCGNGDEIFLDYQLAISEELEKEKGFKLKKVSLGFHGTCRKCL